MESHKSHVPVTTNQPIRIVQSLIIPKSVVSSPTKPWLLGDQALTPGFMAEFVLSITRNGPTLALKLWNVLWNRIQIQISLNIPSIFSQLIPRPQILTPSCMVMPRQID